MNREFLELLYEKKRVAQSAVDDLDAINAIPENAVDEHCARQKAARFHLEEISHLLNSYWSLSEGGYRE